jgi:23S rRNA (adenine2503-C2)-methyltransferase
MPVANRYPLDEVIDACRYYFDMTGRRVTFEYSLVAGVNDTPDDAKELADLINGRTYHDRSDYGRQDHDRPERNTDTRNRNAHGSGGMSHNGMMCHVNLIPVNPIKERDYRKPDASKVTAFAERLKKYGINATVRRTLGSDINASCGQLRKSFIDTNT